MSKQKIYFASDFHLGIPDHSGSLAREKRLVQWLETISKEAGAIFLLGDIFDFWFEYKKAVPKGYVRLLGTIAKITDAGVPVHLFKGNHDIWAFDYLEREVGVTLHRKGTVFEWEGTKFFMAHGDGLGPGDKGYKFLKKVFENKFNQFLFRWLHPDIGIAMGLFFSHRSRLSNYIKGKEEATQLPLKDEMLFHYAKKKATLFPDVDYFIFGHRHVILQEPLSEKAQLIILGDWISRFSYAVFENGTLKLKQFKG